jgi:predicted CopG family antitoxin
MALQNPETEKFYSDLLSLTSKDEWKTFSEYIQEILKGKIETAIDLETVEELQKSKGQVEILRMIVSFRDLLESHYEYIQQEEQDFNEDL